MTAPGPAEGPPGEAGTDAAKAAAVGGEGGAVAAVQEPAATILDDAARRSAIDRGAMLAAIAELPAQLRAAADRASTAESLRFTPGWRPRAVVVLGMGGSAIGADIVRAAFSDRLRVPLIVHREGALPAWVDGDTLVVGSSHSGRTEETLGAFRAALDRRVTCVAITTGGVLGDIAAAGAAPVVPFDHHGQPRAAVGHAAGLLAVVLAGSGVLDADPADELASAARAVEDELAAHGPAIPFETNPAKRLAASLVDRFPVVLGAEHLQPVARRWRTQLNENAKVWAAWDEFPELDHNSVVGFGGPRWTTERLFVLALAAADEPVRVTERRDAALEILRESGTEGRVLTLESAPRLSQAFAGVVIGDLVSVYLALLRGADPTPVDAISRLKVRLAGGPTGP